MSQHKSKVPVAVLKQNQTIDQSIAEMCERLHKQNQELIARFETEERKTRDQALLISKQAIRIRVLEAELEGQVK